MEMYNLGQDEIRGLVSSRKNQEPIEDNREACQRFFRHAHTVVSVLLSSLDRKLALPEGTLARLSPLDKPFATSLRTLVSRPQSIDNSTRITLGGHTDIGTITLLSHILGGLQILPAGKENISENWEYIRSVPGCALINLGDTMVEWTGGVLRSSLHRVVAAPGKQREVTRMSLAYLVRPEHGGSMRRLESEVIPKLGEGEED